MIKNYNDFEFERILESLLLESKIEFSDKFLDVIKQIKRNKIAKDLLSLKRDDVDADFIQNYIDKGNAKDEVTFIADRKVKELLDKEIDPKYKVTQNGRYLSHNTRNRGTYARLGYTVPPGEPWAPPIGTIGTIKAETTSNTSENIYVWFISNDGKQVVINKKALIPYDDRVSLLWTKNRNPIKIGRLVRAILTVAKISFTDKEIEDFVNSYKSTIDMMENALLKFELVKGYHIPNWYNIENYADGGQSTLGNSCMAEVDPDYFDLYAENPACSMLILFSDEGEMIDGKWKSDTIRGRALVWKTDQGDIFMDRIYTNHDSDVKLFKSYAYQAGWWAKEEQNTSTSFTVSNGSSKKTPIYTVKLNRSEFEYYPYVDSLSLINFDSKIISNNPIMGDVEAQAHLNDTDGSFECIDGYDPD